MRRAISFMVTGLVVLSACTAAGGGPASDNPATVSPAASATASVDPTASAPACPNPHGGVCLGRLAAGTYTTRVFETPLTYTVADGWTNDEDLPGNFILFPPTASREGIDSGTADYVGVYDGITVARADCEEGWEPDIEQSPAAMAAWFMGHDGLAASEPVPVTVGGLEGLVLDLPIADGYTGGCHYEGYEGIPIVPLFIGAGLAEVHHVALGENLTRLYLLHGQDGRVVAIEVSDVPGGIGLEDLDAIVDDFRFSTGS